MRLIIKKVLFVVANSSSHFFVAKSADYPLVIRHVEQFSDESFNRH